MHKWEFGDQLIAANGIIEDSQHYIFAMFGDKVPREQKPSDRQRLNIDLTLLHI